MSLMQAAPPVPKERSERFQNSSNAETDG